MLRFTKSFILLHIIPSKTDMLRPSKAIFLLFLSTVLIGSIQFFTISVRENITFSSIKSLVKTEKNITDNNWISKPIIVKNYLINSETKHKNIKIPFFVFEEEDDTNFSKRNSKANQFSTYYNFKNLLKFAVKSSKILPETSFQFLHKLPLFITIQVFRI